MALEMELQAAVSWLVRVLGTKLGLLQKLYVLVTTEGSLQPQTTYFVTAVSSYQSNNL